MKTQIEESSSPTERQAFWRDQLLQWAQSGMGQKQFCRQRGLSPHAFTWWKAKYRDELNLPYRAVHKSSSKHSKNHFVEVKVSSHKTESLYEVVLSNGRSIRVTKQFDPDVLRKLIAAVE
jgi:23S rRNA-/tRNA-specific pseudouridylate synthase